MQETRVVRADVVIVGSGHAGAQTAIALRQRGFAGSVAIVGDEPDWPYERPPLSKDYLSGTKAFERILLRPATFWTDRDITVLRGRRVTAIDPVAKVARLHDGGTIGYGTLVWAGGGSPRRLSCGGHDLGGVHAVRTRGDVDRMIAELDGTRQVAIVGGGYIGLEAAAVLTKLGKSVTLIEAQDRLLARVAGRAVSAFIAAEHRRHGVDIRLNAAVDRITGGGRADGVQLGDGSRVPADMVVVGIGIVPAVAPLIAAGADGGDGVAVDDHCRTSLEGVFAIGDCASHANRFAGGRRMRLESVQNANDMATTVAKAITGQPEPYAAVPWFWSNQYDLRLQTVGISAGHDAEIVRGDPADRSFSVIYTRVGRVVALDCINATKDYVGGRAIVERGVAVRPADVMDTSVPLKTLAA